MTPLRCRGLPLLFQVCVGQLILLFGSPTSPAKEPTVGGKAPNSRAEVLRLLFEADVYAALHDSKRARELYQSADPSGICPEPLVSAYFGHGEALFLEMESARRGDIPALRSALDRLFLSENAQPKHPRLALDLFEAAKRANPKSTIPDEAEIVELLKMASAAAPFDLNAFLNQHNLAASEPYFCWKLAEEASTGGRFGKADAQLVLQLAVCGSGSLSERLSAVRAAYANRANNGGAKFEYKAHISPPVATEPVQNNEPEKEDYELRAERLEKTFQADFNRFEAVFKNPRVLSVDLKGVPAVVCSDDGKLRILSWDTDTGGTLHIYCSMAQFKSPDGKAGYALLQHPDLPAHDQESKVPIFGEVNKIDTVVTDAKQTVYLVRYSARISTQKFAEGITAVSLQNGKIKQFPLFKTKREILSQINFTSSASDEGELPEFQFSESNGYTLLVPIISDLDKFRNNFLKYTFDGKYFSYQGVQHTQKAGAR
jgi:hypothetical protein